MENRFSRVREIDRRVKRWQSGAMVLRWTAAGVLEAQPGSRQLAGYRAMPILVAALRPHDAQFTRGCVWLLADSSLTGQKVAWALSQVVAERGAPVSITVDNGTDFVSKAMNGWARTSMACYSASSSRADRWKTATFGRATRQSPLIPRFRRHCGSHRG
jgi:hypothetical protein